MILFINMSKEGALLLVSQASLEHSNMFRIGEVGRVLAFTATSHLQRPGHGDNRADGELSLGSSRVLVFDHLPECRLYPPMRISLG